MKTELRLRRNKRGDLVIPNSFLRGLGLETHASFLLEAYDGVVILRVEESKPEKGDEFLSALRRMEEKPKRLPTEEEHRRARRVVEALSAKVRGKLPFKDADEAIQWSRRRAFPVSR